MFTLEALAANPAAQMPSWAAFVALQDTPVDWADPLGELLAGQRDRQATRDAA